jgi:hypothetical protein
MASTVLQSQPNGRTRKDHTSYTLKTLAAEITKIDGHWNNFLHLARAYTLTFEDLDHSRHRIKDALRQRLLVGKLTRETTTLNVWAYINTGRSGSLNAVSCYEDGCSTRVRVDELDKIVFLSPFKEAIVRSLTE